MCPAYRNAPDLTNPGLRFHILIEIGGNRQHLLHEHTSLNIAMDNIESAALDELEALNNCNLSCIDDAIMNAYIAKRVGDNCIEIIERKTKAVVTRYTAQTLSMKKNRDGRPRWNYRGYFVNTNTKKNRFCVVTADDTPITVRGSLTAALACIDDIQAGITPEGVMTSGVGI